MAAPHTRGAAIHAQRCGIFERAFEPMNLSDLLSTVFARRYRRRLPLQSDSRPLSALADDLVGTTGEISGLAIAEDILSRFEIMDDAQKLEFFQYLATAMNIDPANVRRTLEAYEKTPSKASYRAFASAAEPARQEMVRRLNRVPGATAALVRMRADLLRIGRGMPDLEALDLDFRHLFASWFNRGFLVLRPINWESPAHILEKIIAYEAVHTIDSWDDLRRRLEPTDRRCFAFFHPSMPDEPLIFVEVALNKGIPGSVQTLLAQDRKARPEAEADTAVFYSISNCQPGLANISFGNSLIKQVVSDLAAELTGLTTFVTLSPIPGLTKWLAHENHAWDCDQPGQMKALAADYLLNAKAQDGLPVDPVARFHLGNGAIIHAVHADADISENGRSQSGGAMVNYLYDLRDVSQNHEAFVSNKNVAATPYVHALAREAARARTDER
jgi:malonyl-CoA decarboxylase